MAGLAKDAEQLVGRSGLLIHGGSRGAPGYWRGQGQLRATQGCVRLSDADMQRLTTLLGEAQEDLARAQSTAIEVTLTVAEFPASIAAPPL